MADARQTTTARRIMAIKWHTNFDDLPAVSEDTPQLAVENEPVELTSETERATGERMDECEAHDDAPLPVAAQDENPLPQVDVSALLGYDRQTKRSCPCKVITDREAAYKTDCSRFPEPAELQYDDSPPDKPTTLVYFTDASHREWYQSAGVVWRTEVVPLKFKGKATLYEHRVTHGDPVRDLETAGIAMALVEADKTVSASPSSHFKLVKVYSDALCALEDLRQCSFESLSFLGMAPLEPGRRALNAIFECADRLLARGVQVELHWVKAHHKSEGNEAADRIVGQATIWGRDVVWD